MLSFWLKVADEVDAYCKAFLAVVVDHQKGSPGKTRACMFYSEGGEQVGTIGGGAMEARLVKEARNALRDGFLKPGLRRLEHQATGGETASGLICGGSQTVVSLVLDQSDRPVIHKLVERLQADQPGCLVIGPEGISFEEELLDHPSTELTETGTDWKVRLGLLNRRRMLIAGCGHCGAALARQMRLLGFQVTVDEPRKSLFTLRNLPRGVKTRVRPFAEAGRELGHADLTYAVVMAPSCPDDVDALASLIPLPFPFVGVMGSSSKLARIRETLLNRGFSEKDLQRLEAPVGISMKSDTPEEIAVSIAAQILRLPQQV